MHRAQRFLLALVLFASAAVTSAQDRAPRVPGIDVGGMDLSVRPQDDFFRYVNGRWADNTPIPGGPVQLRHIRDPARARPGGGARDHRGGRPRAGGARLEQPEGRRSLQELHGRGADRVAGRHAAQRASWRRSRSISDSTRSAGGVRASGARRRAAALRGDRRRRSAQLRTVCRADVAVGARHARPRLLPAHRREVRRDRARPTRPTSRGCSRSRISPIPKAPPRASSRSRPKIAEKQWDRARNRDRNATYNKMGVGVAADARRRTSTGRRIWRRCPAARRTRSAT